MWMVRRAFQEYQHLTLSILTPVASCPHMSHVSVNGVLNFPDFSQLNQLSFSDRIWNCMSFACFFYFDLNLLFQ